MKKKIKYCLPLLLMITANLAWAGGQAFQAERSLPDSFPRTILLFFDGLRPDYITEKTMPNLYRLKKSGSYGKRHHSVYPTFTRVNASSYSSGSYPATNGIMGNEVYFPEIDKAHSLNTSVANLLDRITAATGNNLLTALSLGEILQSSGSRMMVFSDGSQGQAYLQNHKVSGGAIINTELILPEFFREQVIREMGSPPAFEELNRPRHKWITDAFFRYGLAPDGPLVSAIWYADPDETAHSTGVGSPLTMECLKIVDNELGRILQTLKERHLEESYNIIISADHGFITRYGTEWPQEFLIKRGLKKDKDSDDVVLADGAIYVKDRDSSKIRQIVAALQEQDWVGGIFTRGAKPGSLQGWVQGTLSFESVHWDHPERAADILVTDYWNDRVNAYGYPGASYLGGGPASHGGFSPYEVHIALIASGPSFKRSYESELPTSNVDIVPTILHLYGLPVPPVMDGRVMHELFKGNKQPNPKLKIETIKAAARSKSGLYKLNLQRSVLGKYIYLDFAQVIREK